MFKIGDYVIVRCLKCENSTESICYDAVAKVDSFAPTPKKFSPKTRRKYLVVRFVDNDDTCDVVEKKLLRKATEREVFYT